jgi:hypothetical protein
MASEKRQTSKFTHVYAHSRLDGQRQPGSFRSGVVRFLALPCLASLTQG